MSKNRRRYEVMLPMALNDGSPVPEEWFGEAVLEVVDQFGGASFQPFPIEGMWRHEGVLYHDKHRKLVVDVPDTVKNRRWMKRFKDRWKAKLEQLELWMVSYRIEVE